MTRPPSQRRAARAATLSALAGCLALPALSACSRPCADDPDLNLAICGDFGDLAFALFPNQDDGSRIDWPGAATDRSSILLSSNAGLKEVSSTGELTTHPADGAVGGSSAVSLDAEGTAFVVAGAQVVAVSDSGAATRWTQSVVGEGAAAPPAVGEGLVHVSLTTDGRQNRSLVSLVAATGEVTSTRAGASAPVIREDGGLLFMLEPQDCGATFGSIVAENARGEVLWTHEEASGLRDFAPGPDGEVYVVSGDRLLKRLSSEGRVEWSFEPDCASCTVAAAPTVTTDAIYFPVWEGIAPNPGCDEALPSDVDFNVGLDPLYALTRDGKLKWSYDGFMSLGQRYDEMGGMLGLAMASKVQHHPAGRPVVTAEGTLFVPCDGGVVSLDLEGRELGYALYAPWTGETSNGDGGFMTGRTTVQPGFAPPPLLAPNGQLHVWDGMQLRTFETNKKPAAIPWSAPFGGFRNAGRVGG
jgi:hypothetical protein